MYWKQIIIEAEKAGCNYLSIDYNCDHPDYTFYGLDVHPASKEEINFIENKEKKEEKEDYAQKLRNQASEILKEANRIEEYNGKNKWTRKQT